MHPVNQDLCFFTSVFQHLEWQLTDVQEYQLTKCLKNGQKKKTFIRKILYELSLFNINQRFSMWFVHQFHVVLSHPIFSLLSPFSYLLNITSFITALSLFIYFLYFHHWWRILSFNRFLSNVMWAYYLEIRRQYNYTLSVCIWTK